MDDAFPDWLTLEGFADGDGLNQHGPAAVLGFDGPAEIVDHHSNVRDHVFTANLAKAACRCLISAKPKFAL